MQIAGLPAEDIEQQATQVLDGRQRLRAADHERFGYMVEKPLVLRDDVDVDVRLGL